MIRRKCTWNIWCNRGFLGFFFAVYIAVCNIIRSPWEQLLAAGRLAHLRHTEGELVFPTVCICASHGGICSLSRQLWCHASHDLLTAVIATCSDRLLLIGSCGWSMWLLCQNGPALHYIKRSKLRCSVAAPQPSRLCLHSPTPPLPVNLMILTCVWLAPPPSRCI